MNTCKNHSHFALAAAAALCLCPILGAQADATAAGLPTRTVHYADLNLNTQAGVNTLYQRIRTAADLVCGDVASRDLTQAAAAKACVARAVTASVRSVDNPKLTSEFKARVGLTEKPINVASLR